MTRRRLVLRGPRVTRPAGWVIVALMALAATASARRFGSPAELAARLTDHEFWTLSADASEPGGVFRNANITNITSNELEYQYVIGDLVSRTKPGGVYLGVGPEQNFTYMTALRPSMAVIFDIRRGNLDLQLMYKAIFELAKDRADFVSMLFAKPRPTGLGPASTAEAIFNAFESSATSDALYARDRQAIEDQLVKVHGFPLTSDNDLAGIEDVYQTFYASGYAIRASPTYADLMTATDERGAPRSFLATDASFAWLKDLETRNLVVPVVGDFGGPKAIRAIGAYLKAHEAIVTAFYLSNVEQYLGQDGKWDAFCRNVATLPLDGSSTFIRSVSGGGYRGSRGGPGFTNSLGAMAQETRACQGF